MATRNGIKAADAPVGVQHPPIGPEALSVNDVGRLLLRSAGSPALVAPVNTSRTQAGADIVSLDQHSNKRPGETFMQRTMFHLRGLTTARDAFECDFGPRAAVRFNMDFRLTGSAEPKRAPTTGSKPTTAYWTSCGAAVEVNWMLVAAGIATIPTWPKLGNGHKETIRYVEWLRVAIRATEPRNDDPS